MGKKGKSWGWLSKGTHYAKAAVGQLSSGKATSIAGGTVALAAAPVVVGAVLYKYKGWDWAAPAAAAALGGSLGGVPGALAFGVASAIGTQAVVGKVAGVDLIEKIGMRKEPAAIAQDPAAVADAPAGFPAPGVRGMGARRIVAGYRNPNIVAGARARQLYR